MGEDFWVIDRDEDEQCRLAAEEFANATPEQRDAMIEMVRQAGRSIRGYWMGEMFAIRRPTSFAAELHRHSGQIDRPALFLALDSLCAFRRSFSSSISVAVAAACRSAGICSVTDRKPVPSVVDGLEKNLNELFVRFILFAHKALIGKDTCTRFARKPLRRKNSTASYRT